MDIRLAARPDAEQICGIYAPFCGPSSPVSFEEIAPTSGEMAGRIEANTTTFPWLVGVADTGRILGYVYASRHRDRAAYRWSVDVTAYVAADARGSGVGSRLYTVLFRLLRAQGFYRAYAGITLPNEASVGLHRAFGFEQIACYRSVGYKAGAWRDVSWWELELLNASDNAAPVHPVTVVDLLSDQALENFLAE